MTVEKGLVDYMHLSDAQRTVMFAIIVLTNFLGFPQILYVYRKGMIFESWLFSTGLICSIMYHTCEVYSCTIIMDEYTWHKLDNILSITSAELFALFLTGTIRSQYFKYSTIVSTIIIQEKYPIVVSWTILPIVIYSLIALSMKFTRKKQIVNYHKKNLILTVTFLGIGIVFFILGTDQINDYLRIYHGLWHLSAAFFTWFGFRSLTFKDGDKFILKQQ